MKRIFIILTMVFASLSALDAQAQTKEFKELIETSAISATHYRNSGEKFEITQLSGAVIQQLMPKAIKDKKGVENRINSIFQVVMGKQAVGYFNSVKKGEQYGYKQQQVQPSYDNDPERNGI